MSRYTDMLEEEAAEERAENLSKFSKDELFKEYGLEYIDIKIAYESDMLTMVYGCYHDFKAGQILRVFEVTSRMVKDKLFDREGYYIPGYGIIHKGFVTSEITDKDYSKQLKTEEAELLKKIEEKKLLDKELNRLSRNMNKFREMRRKAKEKV